MRRQTLCAELGAPVPKQEDNSQEARCQCRLQAWIWELSLELRVSSRRLTRVLVWPEKDGGHRRALRSFVEEARDDRSQLGISWNRRRELWGQPVVHTIEKRPLPWTVGQI